MLCSIEVPLGGRATCFCEKFKKKKPIKVLFLKTQIQMVLFFLNGEENFINH